MGASAESNDAGKRYLKVAQALMLDIRNGVYVVGSFLPTELELSAMFGASRSTIRLALGVLHDRGYISRRQGIGTLVEKANPGTTYVQSLNSLDDLINVAAREVRTLRQITAVTFDRPTSRHFGAPLGSDWMRFSGPRIDAKTGRNVCWADIYVDAAFGDIVDAVKAAPTELISNLLEHQFNQSITEVVQSVLGVLIDAEMAKELDAVEGEAGLMIIRQYRNDKQRILQLSQTIYPAQRVVVTTHLKRSKG